MLLPQFDDDSYFEPADSAVYFADSNMQNLEACLPSLRHHLPPFHAELHLGIAYGQGCASCSACFVGTLPIWSNAVMLPEPVHRAQPLRAEAPAGLAVTWLGTSSGAPTHRRNVSSIALRTPKATFLVDCGEGTIHQMQAASIDPARIARIFITHLHGDHCFGIPGVLAAISAARAKQRTASEPLHMFGPPGTIFLKHALG